MTNTGDGDTQPSPTFYAQFAKAAFWILHTTDSTILYILYIGGERIMKKRIIIIIVLALIALIAFSVFLLRPCSFSSIAPDCTSITVTYIDNTLDHSNETKVFERGTEKFEKVQSVLENYTYHRSFRTFFGDGSMEGNRAGYWLHIYLDTGDDRDVIICGGTGEISIDGRIYRVGYWGDGPSLSWMNEMADIFYSCRR